LSCTYDKAKDEITLNWISPPDNYDNIIIRMFWRTHFRSQEGIRRVDGNSSSLRIKKQDISFDINDLDIRVFGFRNNLSSSLGAVYIHNQGRTQEELFGVPFTNVAPNWKVWGLDEGEKKLEFKEGIRTALISEKNKGNKPIKIAEDKPFYQVIKSSPQGGTGGICRQFLGLTGGHTYRLSIRLNTLENDSNDNSWSYSLHAIADQKGKEKLTENQMAGLETLPNGKKGLDAGRIVNYNSGKNTKGTFETNTTDITLPQDSNSITVWLRHTGKGTSGVGFDWIKLEDLGVE
jgi:hypothetical protein